MIDGEYLGINPALDEDPECLGTRPYYQGWLYKVKGEPDPNSLDLDGYCRHLDATIDKMLEGT